MANKLYCRRVDFRDTPEEAQFREEVRAWLHESLPDELKGHRGGAARFDGPEVRAWSRALYDGGWVGIAWPKEFGGRGMAPRFQAIYLEEEARAEAPPHVGVIGLGMAGPTIISRGTEEQKARYLTPLLAADEIWCQGFSEPGAGSDLAGVRTSARLEGDRFVLDGQKVWSSYAHIADFCILLARSDPGSERHAGLTYVIVDMHAPGVEVRPLRQITGEAEFNEVYLTDVRIPDADRIGDTGEGWRVSMTTLANERTTIGGGGGAPPRGSGAIAEAVRIWQEEVADRRPALRDRLIQLWVEAEVLRLTNVRAGQNRRAGNPGPEGSIAKLKFAEVNMAIYELCVDLLGADAMVGYEYGMRRAQQLGLTGPAGSSRKMFLRARANSIEGGTSEIQRNILGERVLGLPGEPRVDKDLPWSQVPR